MPINTTSREADLRIEAGGEAPAPPSGNGGVWSLEDGRLVSLAPSHGETAIVLVPSEHVLMIAVDLPLASRRERISALPFALEDYVAEPLDEVHVALGTELAPRRHLAGAVRHVVMAEWVDQITRAGLSRCSLVPDALALPIPEEGAWSVQLANGRVLARTDQSTGFATPLEQMEAVWNAAGRPFCVSYGEALPPGIAALQGEVELEPLTTRLMVPALDLRQGLYARPRKALPASARKALVILAIGTIAHGVLAMADTLALQRIAQDRREEAQALVQLYLPGTKVDGDFAAEVARILAEGERARSPFFPLLARTSAALEASGASAGVRAMAFDWATGSLTLRLEGADILALQRVQSALASAGLDPVSPGAATTQGGSAEAQIVIQDVSARAAR